MSAGNTHPSFKVNHWQEMEQRQQIRQQMRQQRRNLSKSERRHCATQLAHTLSKSRLFHNSRHIALYLANDAEIDPGPLIEAAWQQGKQCYLPVLGLRRSNRLWFIPYDSDSRLTANRFGIPEPVHPRHQRQLKPQSLDLILMPLVAFDPHGNRLGMGGGFYDRTLAFLHHRHHWRKPHLIGLAYEFQHVPQLPHQNWDVPLDAIATEHRIYYSEHLKTT